MSESGWSFDTRQIHVGAVPDPTTGARAVPIYQTTAFSFRDTQHAADLFSLAEPGNIYTRIMNPTQQVAEERIASLEGGVGALLVASGQAATTTALLNVAENGDHVVASSSLYGGTYNLFHYTFPKLGVEVSFVEDPDSLDAWRSAVRPNTKAFFAETIGNPKIDVLDIEGVAGVAHEAGVPLIVDNTVATPYLIRPIEHGADIVTHSTTKFISGHGTVIGGAVVDGGKFDFGKDKQRFPGFNTPDESYHGLVYTEAFGNLAYILKLRVQGLRDVGAAISPFNSFLILQGIETLSLRMERHSQNALQIARFLNEHPAVSWVNYPGLPTHESYETAQKYWEHGLFGAMLGFGIKGGKEAGRKFIESVEIFSHLANIGDAKSLVIHPATTTHSQLDDEAQAATGVTPDYIRVSVGLETVGDLISDLEQALAKATSDLAVGATA